MPEQSNNYSSATMSLAAVGIVFGDIGTSPLYAFKQCFLGINAVAVNEANILGVASLIFWSLIFSISLKYLFFIMRADNESEGGIIALVARLNKISPKKNIILILIGVFGASLLYGDSTITPAISVLSAIEGLALISSAMDSWVIPITVTILVLLFWTQHFGTLKIGKVFGPIMLMWFCTIALLGVINISHNFAVLQAINPVYAYQFFMTNGINGFMILGTVFLVVTGAEALYADMGHFGLLPIRNAWFFVVLPSLLLNYFGQAALVLQSKQEALHPFFHLAPGWALYPLVIFATIATIIASQAVISGTFSLTKQAIQIGFLPRMNVVHTSLDEEGQIYVPAVNWLLMMMTIGLVLGFQSSDKLGAAYGLAVSLDMTITTLLAAVVLIHSGVKRYLIIPVAIIFWLFDWSFLVANTFKFIDGGWYPILVGLIVFFLMLSWRKGRQHLSKLLQKRTESTTEFIKLIEQDKLLHRVSGTAIFMTNERDKIPPILLHQMKHNQVLHKKIMLVTVKVEDVPRVPIAQRLEIDILSDSFFRILIRFGFMQQLNVPSALRHAKNQDFDIDVDNATYFLSRETLILTSEKNYIKMLEKKIFTFIDGMSFQARPYFQIPPEQVVELGLQIKF